MILTHITPRNFTTRPPNPYIIPGLQTKGEPAYGLALFLINTLNPQQIIDKVARAYGVTVQEMTQKTRKQKTVIPRQIAQYLIVNTNKLNISNTARCFSQHHATVLYAIRTVEARYETDKVYREMFLKIICL